MPQPYEGLPGLRIIDHVSAGPCTAIDLDDTKPPREVVPCTTVDSDDYKAPVRAADLSLPANFKTPEGFILDTSSGVYSIDPKMRQVGQLTLGAFKDPEGMVRADSPLIRPADARKQGHLYDPETGRYKN